MVQARERQTVRTKMVYGYASGRRPNRLAPGIGLREGYRNSAVEHVGQEYVASWICLQRLGIGIEFADEGASIILRRGRKLGDEGFDQIAAGIFERFRT